MINLNTYIIEKLHLNKDIIINDNDVFKDIRDIVNDYFQKKLQMKSEEFIYQFEDEEGHITDKKSKLKRIYFYSKHFDPRVKDRDIDKAAKYLENNINKIKPINKTEVFATSIYIYFK